MTLQMINEQNFPDIFDNSLYRQILSLIRAGTLEGVHLSELTKATGLSDRAVRKAIEEIRRAGVIICTDCVHGYFFPENIRELSSYIRQEQRRGNSTLDTIATAKSLYKELQEVLNG